MRERQRRGRRDRRKGEKWKKGKDGEREEEGEREIRSERGKGRDRMVRKEGSKTSWRVSYVDEKTGRREGTGWGLGK